MEGWEKKRETSDAATVASVVGMRGVGRLLAAVPAATCDRRTAVLFAHLSCLPWAVHLFPGQNTSFLSSLGGTPLLSSLGGTPPSCLPWSVHLYLVLCISSRRVPHLSRLPSALGTRASSPGSTPLPWAVHLFSVFPPSWSPAHTRWTARTGCTWCPARWTLPPGKRKSGHGADRTSVREKGEEVEEEASRRAPGVFPRRLAGVWWGTRRTISWAAT